MKDDKQIEIQTSNNFLWSIIFIFLILGSVFVVRQMLYVPVNTTTVKAFVLDESKQHASPVKKYFPTPYSVQDLVEE